ncbi:MAG: hypothetical protein ABIB47_05085 [Candidatus Woesearchaeota archaeon]
MKKLLIALLLIEISVLSGCGTYLHPTPINDLMGDQPEPRIEKSECSYINHENCDLYCNTDADCKIDKSCDLCVNLREDCLASLGIALDIDVVPMYCLCIDNKCKTIYDNECSFDAFNCDNFATQRGAQMTFELCGGTNNDIHDLDIDRNGIACDN